MSLFLYLLVVSIVVLIVGYTSLLLAVYLTTLDFHLSLSIVQLEVECLSNPKLKTVSFLVMINTQLTEEIERIVSIKDIDLWKELRKDKEYKEITLNDIKKIKSNAKYQLKKSKENNLITFEEVDQIIEKEGLKSFLYSIKRTSNRYSSFEQKERFVGSEESVDLFNIIYRKRGSKSLDKEAFFGGTFYELIEESIAHYKNEFIMTNII